MKKNIREKHLSKCNHGYKMLHVYISVTVPDSQNSYFLYINNDGWRLCLEYPSSRFVGLSVILFVCLSVCPPVFSETARYTLMKLCAQVTYVVHQKPIDFGVN